MASDSRAQAACTGAGQRRLGGALKLLHCPSLPLRSRRLQARPSALVPGGLHTLANPMSTTTNRYNFNNSRSCKCHQYSNIGRMGDGVLNLPGASTIHGKLSNGELK